MQYYTTVKGRLLTVLCAAFRGQIGKLHCTAHSISAELWLISQFSAKYIRYLPTGFSFNNCAKIGLSPPLESSIFFSISRDES